MLNFKSLPEKLLSPVDNSPLIIFRVIFGLLIFLESAGAIFTGWVKRVFIDPSFTFTLIGFERLQPLPGNGMYFYYALMALFGIMVMIGYYYRVSLGIFTLLWTLSYWMQKSSYNNHYYLLILLCLIMIIMPAHKYFSVDVKKRRVKESLTCPGWCYAIIILQLTIVYTFAGLAKLYPDWLNGLPVQIWFSAKAGYPIIGDLLQQEWLQWMVVYGGIVYDFFIVPLLFWKRTRLFAFCLSLLFHLFNSMVFQIGIFPYLMIALTIFFFNPEKIRALFFKSKPALNDGVTISRKFAYHPLLVATISVYFFLQIYLPLRHLHYEGNVHWTEEGHRLAWQMMLRSKYGYAYFEVINPETDEKWQVKPEHYLSPKQALKLPLAPDLIWQFSQFLEEEFTAREEINKVEVYAYVKASLNGRPLQPFVDSTVNMAQEEWEPFQHSDWLMPLKE